MSYIIKNGLLIAKTLNHMKSGERVSVSYRFTKNNISADSVRLLVNPVGAVVSNAKKWDSIYIKTMGVPSARVLDPHYKYDLILED